MEIRINIIDNVFLNFSDFIKCNAHIIKTTVFIAIKNKKSHLYRSVAKGELSIIVIIIIIGTKNNVISRLYILFSLR